MCLARFQGRKGCLPGNDHHHYNVDHHQPADHYNVDHHHHVDHNLLHGGDCHQASCKGKNWKPVENPSADQC